MRYESTDTDMLDRLRKAVAAKHGPGFEYSHSIKETEQERKELELSTKQKCGPMEDIHYFVQSGRRVICTRDERVGAVSIPYTYGCD